ncbi:MAG: hypothetical protein MRJ93_07565 [Nitrososphaeraceae archaeon]|nr:hypothetical protein [Nitrososphaeraceae archaeon]
MNTSYNTQSPLLPPINISYENLESTLRKIQPFRTAILLGELRWNSYKLKLEKEGRKILSQMFSIPSLYNTACTCSIKPIRIASYFHVFNALSL